MTARLRFIPTRVHGLLDYPTGLLLLASPWLFRFDHGSMEMIVPIMLGSSILIYSLFTNYEHAVVRAIPMPVHLLIDAAGGLLLALSPWLFGFAHFVYLPHVIIGLSEVAVALVTQTQPTRSSGQPIIG